MATSFLNRLKSFILRSDFKDYDREYDAALVRFFMSDGFEQLKERYARFNDILAENNVVLTILSELQKKVHTHRIPFSDFRREVSRLLDRIVRLVTALNRMSPQKYDWLLPVAKRLKKEIETKMQTQAIGAPQLLYSLDQVSVLLAGELGDKAAKLGEAKNILNLSVPKGMAFSTLAFREFMAENDLDERVGTLTAGLTLDDSDRIREISTEIRDAMLSGRIPPELEEAAVKAFKDVKDVSFFAVRSSAIGEDGGQHSFAGQYQTILNVPPSKVLDAYKEVCAGLYSERAVRYRLAKGIPFGPETAMAVLALEMVPARAAGICYTMDPKEPDSNRLLISAVWGLGQYAVDATVPPDTIVLDRDADGAVLEKTAGKKHTRLVVDTAKGTVHEEEVPANLQDEICLSSDELERLYTYARQLEGHFGGPQDIEWAIHPDGTLYILQVRPLEVAPIPKYRVP
ncbi:MAG: PEP/pyruvate-binding domain-containing protein, partial [Deltaproteobacteria bacterium]|nr:PEP/pyruvate-binding domain-containing protein [Deltaproteobacteria bacterium]